MPITVTMDRNNTDMIVLGGNDVFTLTPSGQVTTLANTGTGNNHGCSLGQDGKYVLCASVYGQSGFVKLLDPTTKTVSTLYQGSISHFRASALNEDNGNLLICRWDASGDLLEFDMANHTLRTIRSGFYGLDGVDVVPATGNYACALYYSFGNLTIVSPQGAIVSTINASWNSGVKVDDATGHYFCVTGTGSTSVNTVTEYDMKGSAINTFGPYTGYDIKFVDIYGSRQVTGSGQAIPGATYSVDFSFPGAGSITYVAALSFSQRPGFPIGGSTLNLAPDALFWASVQGLFVSKFQGVLDSAGRASGSIHIPSFMPKGVTLYCSAIATNGLIFLTGNTLGITIR